MESPQLSGHNIGLNYVNCRPPTNQNCCNCKFGIVEKTCDMSFFGTGTSRQMYFSSDYDQLFCKRKPDKQRTYDSNWCGEWRVRDD